MTKKSNSASDHTVASVTASVSSIAGEPGQVVTYTLSALRASGTLINGKTYSAVSANPSVVRVDSVVGRVVTCSILDLTAGVNVTGTCEGHNAPPVAVSSTWILSSLLLSPSPVSIEVGASSDLAASARNRFGLTMPLPTITGSTTASSVATTGTIAGSTVPVNGIGAGSAVVRVRNGAVLSNTVAVSVTEGEVVLVATSIQVTPASLSVTESGADPISAQILDQFGNPFSVAGLVLTWSDNLGSGGSFGAATSTTNASGIATVTFTAGPDEAISHRIHAVSGSLVGTSDTIDVFAPSSEHPNEPAGYTQLSETLTGDTVPPTQDVLVPGSANDIGWIQGPTITQVVDSAVPIGSTNVLNIDFPPGMIGGGAPGKCWTYKFPTNPQLWPLHPKRIYLSFWYKLSANFPINLVANKMGYAVNGPSGGGTASELGFLITASADYPLVGGNIAFVPGGATQITAALWPFVGIQGSGGIGLDGVLGDGGVGQQLRPNVGVNPFDPTSFPNTFQVRRGVWQHHELLLSLNTAGNYDGSVSWWLGGVPVMSYLNRVAFSATAPVWQWATWWPVYGGGGQVPSDGGGGYHRIKDLYISGHT